MEKGRQMKQINIIKKHLVSVKSRGKDKKENCKIITRKVQFTQLKYFIVHSLLLSHAKELNHWRCPFSLSVLQLERMLCHCWQAAILRGAQLKVLYKLIFCLSLIWHDLNHSQFQHVKLPSPTVFCPLNGYAPWQLAFGSTWNCTIRWHQMSHTGRFTRAPKPEGGN